MVWCVDVDVFIVGFEWCVSIVLLFVEDLSSDECVSV